MEFDVLRFIADHAGMSLADALTDAYNIGKLAGVSESDENDKRKANEEAEVTYKS